MSQQTTSRSGATQFLSDAYRRAQDGARNLATAGQRWAASPLGQAVVRSNPMLASQAALLDAVRLGLAGPAQRLQTPTRGGAPRPSAQEGMQQVVKSLDGNPLAKGIAGHYARQAALVPGVARGLWHTAEDVGGMAAFAARLSDPLLDSYLSPPGESAPEQLFKGGLQLADRVVYAVENPRSVVDGIAQGLDRANKNLNPYATPQGGTLAEELARSWKIGLNQGELAFDVGSMADGGAELKGLRLLMRGGKPLTAAYYTDRGIAPHLAEYFAEPYVGIGHHVINKNAKLPSWLGGGPVPESIRQNPFFVVKPGGLTKGEFSERHARIDRHYNGGHTGRKRGYQGWSANDLGWTMYDPLRLLWYGSTPELKGILGGGAGLGLGVGEMTEEEQSR